MTPLIAWMSTSENVCLLAWRIIDRIFILPWNDGTNNINSIRSSDNSISHKLDSIFLFNAFVDMLLLTHILWFIQAFLPISSCMRALQLVSMLRKFNTDDISKGIDDINKPSSNVCINNRNNTTGNPFKLSLLSSLCCVATMSYFHSFQNVMEWYE